MSYDTGQETIYFDQKWLKKIRRHAVKSNGFQTKQAKLKIDEEKKQVFFEPYVKSIDTQKVQDELKHRIEYLERVKQQLLETEKISLIKEYYVKKSEETKLRTQIQLIQLDTAISKEEQSKHIGEIHKELFPIPDISYLEQFINEFIYFFTYMYKNSLYNVRSIENFEEICRHEFYNIKKIPVNIDCEQIVKVHSFFSKQENANLENNYTPKEIKVILGKFLHKIEFENYSRLKISKNGIFSVNGRRTIKIPGKTSITKRRIYELIAHEILVHVGRSITGKQNQNHQGKKLKMLEIGKTSDIFAIEEGIATYFEQNIFYDSDKHDILNLLNFYVRIIAVHLAQHFDPFVVYKKLETLTLLTAMIKEHDSRKANEHRLSLMTRIYRDYEIPVKGAVNGKVAVYLYGNRMVWEHKEEGKNLFNLFTGKISFEQIQELQQLGFTIPETYLDSSGFPREKILKTINDCFE